MKIRPSTEGVDIIYASVTHQSVVVDESEPHVAVYVVEKLSDWIGYVIVFDVEIASYVLQERHHWQHMSLAIRRRWVQQ